MKLKRCPALSLHKHPEGLRHEHVGPQVRIACTCGVAGPYRRNSQGAGLAWNEMPRAPEWDRDLPIRAGATYWIQTASLQQFARTMTPADATLFADETMRPPRFAGPILEPVEPREIDAD